MAGAVHDLDGHLVGMGGPLWTVRLHDTRDWAQRQADCHWFLRHGKSMWLDGFYYLNFRLVLDRPPGFDAGPGISDVAFYRFLQRSWMLHQLPIAALLFWIGGWPFVVWGYGAFWSGCRPAPPCTGTYPITRTPTGRRTGQSMAP
jgi:hypothetical protein